MKMSSYLDQADETEFEPANKKTVDRWYANFLAFAQGPPSDAEEPTAEQLQALHHKVVILLNAPYVDFAIFGPFNRKVARAMKFVAWVPVGDGSFLRKEIPGPDNVTSWLGLMESVQGGMPDAEHHGRDGAQRLPGELRKARGLVA